MSTIIHYHEEALLDSFDTNKVEFCATYCEHHALQEFLLSNAAYVPNQDDATMPDDDELPNLKQKVPRIKHKPSKNATLLGYA